jgi:hypothetical protein
MQDLISIFMVPKNRDAKLHTLASAIQILAPFFISAHLRAFHLSPLGQSGRKGITIFLISKKEKHFLYVAVFS